MNDKTDKESIEAWLLDVCRELGVPVEQLDDDFFDSGGNSLSVVRLIARTDARFGEDVLTPEEMFESGSVREMAEVVRRNIDRVRTASES